MSHEKKFSPFYSSFLSLCAQKGVAPSVAARDSGISSGAPTAWKNGSIPKPAQREKLCSYFGVPDEVLLGYVEKEKAQELNRIVAVECGIIAMLEEIYGTVESKEVISNQSDWTGHYYLIGEGTNTFVLYDGDIDILEEATKAFLPILVKLMKDTRPENEIIRTYQKELDQILPPQDNG